MSDVYGGPFANDGAGYPAIHDAISSGAQTTVQARLDLLKALIPDTVVAGTASAAGTGASANAKPDFDMIPPHTAVKLRAEIDSLKTVIEAAPHN